MKKRLPILLLALAMLLSLVPAMGTPAHAADAVAPEQDANGTYLIGTAEELYWFAEKVKTQTATDEAANEKYTTGYLKRTKVNARLTADIDLNPGVSFTYDHSTGLVSISKGGTTLYMGTGMKGTLLGNFPIYNGICTLEEWNCADKTDEERAGLREGHLTQMQTKLDALGLRKWTPIGTAAHPYVGNFDGNGHTIDGVYVNDDTVYDAALFGYTATYLHTGEYATRMPGEIKNLTLGGNSLVVGYYADYNGGTEPATGGIVGKMSFDKIENCTNRATVVGKGSLATHNYGVGYAAGVVSILLGTAENCVNYGTIVSPNSAGGVIGHLISSPNPSDDKSSIKNCTNHGSVYADIAISQSLAGGVVARDGGDEGGVGSPITSCVNRGYVEGSCAGGIVQTAGDGAAIKYCANFGEIKGMSSAAGLVDYIYRNGFDLESSYNAGTVALLDRPESVRNPEFIYRKVFPLVSRIRVFNTVSNHNIKNCYNDETVCPAPDGKLFGESITNIEGCSSVPTTFFATGEPAYKMRSWEDGSWMQNLSSETYPHVGSEPRVYENTRWCCHTDTTNKEAHKELFYSNEEGNVTAEHDIGTDGYCKHCGADCRAPILTTDTLLSATEGDWYSQPILTDSAVPQPTTFELVKSETDDTPFTLPSGLNANFIGGTDSRVGISGTPDTGTAGTYTFTVKATNANGTTKKTYTLTITAGSSGGEFQITTKSLPDGVVGQPYKAMLESNDPKGPVTWSVLKDAVPDGLTLDAKTGELSGTPEKAGKYELQIEAARGDGKEAYATLTLTVTETAHSHSWSTWTPLDGGEKHERHCACGEREEADHSFGAPAVVDATYTAEGSKTYTCTACGYQKVEKIAKRPFAFNEGGSGTLDITDGELLAEVSEEGVAAVEIPADKVSSAEIIAVKMPDAIVNFDSYATAVIKDGVESGASIVVRAEETDADALEAAQKAAYDEVTAQAGGSLVLQLEVYKVSGETVTQLFSSDKAAGTATVTIPYPHSAGDTLRCWWIDEAGAKHAIPIQASDPAAGTVTLELPHFSTYVITRTAASSDSGSVPAYGVTVAETAHGAVSVSRKTASRGETVTVTVTPDSGYVLESLTVLDRNGAEIALTEKNGTYTFTMPAGRVEVRAAFMDDNTMLNFFVDVKAGNYFYDAVLWAARKGVAIGTDAARFSPDAPCTRAQAVTFLWRAAGSPAPRSTTMPFADVKAGSYYEQAVLWAVENGITSGTGADSFSPDAVCTRAEIVTFLWRSRNSPAAEGDSPFADVSADAWYAAAVRWAVESGVTSGTDAGVFSPDSPCTRAQIVTFLFRALAE